MTNYDDIINKFDGVHSAYKELEKMDKKILSLQDKLIQKINNPNLLDKLMPTRAEQTKRDLKDEYEVMMMKWQRIAEAPYPQVCKDDAELALYDDMVREMKRNIDSKDGYYHIPDELCQDDFSKGLRKDLETFMKKHDIGIPMDIGLKLENTFLEPGKTWIHRTQIDRDSDYLLRNIGRDGLICNAEDLENTATTFKNYTSFISQAVGSYAYRQNSCKGFILIKTDDEPKIENKKLNPNQIIGFIGNENGKLHDFISREDMAEIIPEYDPELTFKNKEVSENVIDKMINEAKEEITNETIKETHSISKETTDLEL